MKTTLKTLTLLLLAASATAQDEAPDAAAQSLPAYPQIEVKTSLGDFRMELFTSRAPYTVQNFVDYVNAGFYENTVFHRIVGGFVIQAGGYDTNYARKQTRNPIPNESGNGLSNRRGFVAMARTGEPHSADSQFYINLADNIALDPRPTRWGYTVFGRVTEGLEVVDEIGYRPTGPGPTPELAKDVPQEPIVILSMRMLPPETTPPAEVDADLAE